MKYAEERDKEAHKYTCKPQIPAFKEGADWAITQSSVVRGLAEIAELIKTGTPESGLDIYIHTKTIDALKAYSAACAEIEGEK